MTYRRAVDTRDETVTMRLAELHPRFGVEIPDCDLRRVARGSGYEEIRRAFEHHSLLLFRNQLLDDQAHLELGRLFGPIEDRSQGDDGPELKTSAVSNVDGDGNIVAAHEDHVLHLKANQLWHTDSTFLPVPALANIITARVVPTRGGETQIATTRAAWKDLPEGMKNRARTLYFKHRYAHSRQKVSARLAQAKMFTKWEDQTWRALWTNPVTGDEAMYIASHVFGAVGMEDDAAQTLLVELMAWSTQSQYVYTHEWQVGDVLIWDERATVHRGLPWPYEEERTLVSICVSALEADGLPSVRPPH